MVRKRLIATLVALLIVFAVGTFGNSRMGEKFVVVESDPEVVRTFREGLPVVEGSPLEEETLKKKGVKARGLATVLDEDSDKCLPNHYR
ncbi:TPA: hypothetical protein EYP27_05940 [Candidatus Bathyarchaeota archaeon]|nr:hypothetical protein [Candidatus Bathyarchaeota archaeon]